MFERLRKRREFLAAAGGQKTARPAFVLQALRRGDDDPPRFGFTVSKRTAKSAVVRNRIRRRLREAVRLLARDNAATGYDYVVIGRAQALTEPFGKLKSEMTGALQRVSERPRADTPTMQKAGG
jgi:ribonuclease P protein component